MSFLTKRKASQSSFNNNQITRDDKKQQSENVPKVTPVSNVDPQKDAQDKTLQKIEQLCGSIWNLKPIQEIQELINSPNFPLECINQPNQRGQAALYCAARQGYFDAIVLLLSLKGIDIDYRVQAHGGTSLHAASFGGHLNCVALLLAKGADATIVNATHILAKNEATGQAAEAFYCYENKGVFGLLEICPSLKKFFDQEFESRFPNWNEFEVNFVENETPLYLFDQVTLRSINGTLVLTSNRLIFLYTHEDITRSSVEESLQSEIVNNNSLSFLNQSVVSVNYVEKMKILCSFDNPGYKMIDIAFSNEYDCKMFKCLFHKHETSTQPESLSNDKTKFAEDIIGFIGRITKSKKKEEIPPKPRTIDYSVRDSLENILLDEKNPTLLKAATLSKLLEKLTDDCGQVDTDDFLISYNLFANSTEILNGLFIRFEVTEEKATKFRVFNFFKKWTEKFWTDFESEPENIKLMNSFLEPLTKHEEYGTLAKRMLSKIEQKILDGPKELDASSNVNSILNIDLDPRYETMGILDFRSQDIANQITLLDWAVWVKLKESEFITLGWTKKNKLEISPNVTQMTKTFNELSDWVASVVITTENKKKRSQVVQKMIEIAQCLRQLGNYNGMMAIVSGLQRGPVFRMSATFQGLDKKVESTFSEIRGLINTEKNYSELRAAIASINPPVIPYLGMYQTDILFAIEGNSPYIQGLINFFRCRIYSDTLKKIKQYQLKGYEIKTIPALQLKLSNLFSIEEEKLYDISYYLEPREGKEAGPRPDSLIDSYLEKTADLHYVVSNKKDKLKSYNSSNSIGGNRKASMINVSPSLKRENSITTLSNSTGNLSFTGTEASEESETSSKGEQKSSKRSPSSRSSSSHSHNHVEERNREAIEKMRFDLMEKFMEQFEQQNKIINNLRNQLEESIREQKRLSERQVALEQMNENLQTQIDLITDYLPTEGKM